MIKVIGLKKEYKLGKANTVHAVNDVSFEIKKGEIAALVGPSGSGKSTVLNILGGLDRKYKGEVIVDGKDIKKHNKDKFRRNVVQTIFQQFYLVPSLTVEENVMLPVVFGHQFGMRESKKRLKYILEKVGLTDRRKHKPSELSGGQAQRVAIARALMADPEILLADEPTGNLDSKTSDQIIDLLFKINKEEGKTMVIITHDMDLFKDVKHKIFLRDGKVEKETK